MGGLVQSLFLVFGKDLLNFSWLFCIYKDRIGVAEAYFTIESLFLTEIRFEERIFGPEERLGLLVTENTSKAPLSKLNLRAPQNSQN